MSFKLTLQNTVSPKFTSFFAPGKIFLKTVHFLGWIGISINPTISKCFWKLWATYLNALLYSTSEIKGFQAPFVILLLSFTRLIWKKICVCKTGDSKMFCMIPNKVITGSSRLMRISLLRISLLRFFKTITKIWLMRFYGLFILLLRT